MHTSVPAELKELLWQEILLACSCEEGVVGVVVPPDVVVPPEVVVLSPEVVVPPEVVVLPPEVVPLEVLPEVCPEDAGVNWIP